MPILGHRYPCSRGCPFGITHKCLGVRIVTSSQRPFSGKRLCSFKAPPEASSPLKDARHAPVSGTENGAGELEPHTISLSPAPLEGQEKELVALENLVKQERKYGWLLFWIASAAAFGAGIWAYQGPAKAQEFFAGYIIEQALSVDNLFVFVLVFGYFKTPPSGQSQVLTYGIATAAVLRAILIVAGVELVQLFQPVLIVFSAILIASSYKLLTASSSNDGDGHDLSDNEVVQFCRRFIKTSDQYDGNRFFTVMADGTKAATPLLLTLAVVELSDVLFAVDSIPAVFGVTLDPFIVYSSNIFAILSLRAVYSFVSTVMVELRYLEKSVAVVLGFIGIKMLLQVADVNIPTDLSLLFVGLALGAGVGASLLIPEVSKSHSD